MAHSVGVTGATGLIGRALAVRLAARADTPVAFVRGRTPERGERRWDPPGGVETAQVEGLDALVHLAGENLGRGRWTAEYKRRICESRVAATRALCEAIARAERPPSVLVAASALGYYGDRRDEWLDEDSPPGVGFLPDLCVAWEAATEPAREAGVRVVNLRIGVVLSRAGGALPRMIAPFRWGLGGRIGSGLQYVSWVSRRDVVGAILCAIDDARLIGPVNAVAPHPVTSAELALALGSAMGRPSRLAIPAVVVRAALGEAGEALLLHSARIRPARLAGVGYSFAHSEIGPALAAILDGVS
jgi:uncharacterized protein (TIGR01777 family)